MGIDSRSDGVRQIMPIEAQIAELLKHVILELEAAGPALDFDFTKSMEELTEKIKDANAEGVTERAMTYVVLEAIDAIYTSFTEAVPLETTVSIAAYEYDAPGSEVKSIVYEGYYINIEIGKSSDNWNAFANDFDPNERFSKNINGEHYLVPWVVLLVNDPSEDGGIKYTSIPFDKILAARYVNPSIPHPRTV